MKIKLYLSVLTVIVLMAIAFVSCQREDSGFASKNVSKELNTKPRNLPPGQALVPCESCDNIVVTYELKDIKNGVCNYEVHVSTNTSEEFCGQGFILNGKPFPLLNNPQTIFINVGSDPVKLEFTTKDPITGNFISCFTKIFQPCDQCEEFDCSLVNVDYRKIDARSLNDCCIYQFNVTNFSSTSIFVNNFGKKPVNPIEIEGEGSKKFYVEVCEGEDVRLTIGPNMEYCHHACREITLGCFGKK